MRDRTSASLRPSFVTTEVRSHHALPEIISGSKPPDPSGCIASGDHFGRVLSIPELPFLWIRLSLSQRLPGQLRLQLSQWLLRWLSWVSESSVQLERKPSILFL